MRKLAMVVGILSVLATSANAVTWPELPALPKLYKVGGKYVLLTVVEWEREYDQLWNSSDKFGYNIFGAFNPF